MASAKQLAWRKLFISRYVKGKKRTGAARSRGRVNTMARFKRRRSGKRGGMMGSLMHGKFQILGGGIVGALLSGAVLGYASNYVPLSVPYKQEVAGFLGGGLPGALAANVTKGMSGGAAVTGSTQRIYS